MRVTVLFPLPGVKSSPPVSAIPPPRAKRIRRKPSDGLQPSAPLTIDAAASAVRSGELSIDYGGFAYHRRRSLVSKQGARSHDGDGWSARVPDFQGLDSGGDPRRPVRLLRAGPARLPHLHGPSSRARPCGRPGRWDALHRFRHQRGPAGVPAQRADGVRLRVRPRRLSRTRLHRRLPAPLLRHRACAPRRRSLRPGGAADGLRDAEIRCGFETRGRVSARGSRRRRGGSRR
jgi:hypothetical protein